MAKHKYYVTASRLRKAGACRDQVQLFKRVFFGKEGVAAKHNDTKRVAVTKENWSFASRKGLDVRWLYRILFDFRVYWQVKDALPYAYRFGEHWGRAFDAALWEDLKRRKRIDDNGQATS